MDLPVFRGVPVSPTIRAAAIKQYECGVQYPQLNEREKPHVAYNRPRHQQYLQ